MITAKELFDKMLEENDECQCGIIKPYKMLKHQSKGEH